MDKLIKCAMTQIQNNGGLVSFKISFYPFILFSGEANCNSFDVLLLLFLELKKRVYNQGIIYQPK